MPRLQSHPGSRIDRDVRPVISELGALLAVGHPRWYGIGG